MLDATGNLKAVQIVWPNGAGLDPLVLHGDFKPASRFVQR